MYSDKIKECCSRFFPYRAYRVSREEWEAQYAGKKWDWLRGIDEAAHYSVIAGYCHYFNRGGKILDIGCGEGILQEKLCFDKCVRYVGIDISAAAIRAASVKTQTGKTSFIQADADRFQPDELFNIIIFNECLYYFDKPLHILSKYEVFLEEGGHIIISMYDREGTRRLWKLIGNTYSSEDEVLITNKAGVSWTVKVFKGSGKR